MTEEERAELIQLAMGILAEGVTRPIERVKVEEAFHEVQKIKKGPRDNTAPT